jgi:hypothetical protein
MQVEKNSIHLREVNGSFLVWIKKYHERDQDVNSLLHNGRFGVWGGCIIVLGVC